MTLAAMIPDSKTASNVVIAIPTYRRPEMLARAVKSALRQSYPNTLVAVFDNASGDRTAEIMRELVNGEGGGRVVYFCHAENLGLAGNMEAACRWAASHAPYWSLLCDDDIMLPEFVSAAMKGFAVCPDAAYSAAMTLTVDLAGKVLSNLLDDWPKHGVFAPKETFDPIFRYGHPVMTSMLWRADMVEVFLRHLREANYCDVVATLEANISHPVYVTRQIGGLFISHGLNASHKEDPLEVWQKILVMFASKTANPAATIRSIQDALNSRMLRECRMLAYDAIEHGNSSALEHYTKTLSQTFHRPISAAFLLKIGKAIIHRPRKLEQLYQVLLRWIKPTCLDMSQYLKFDHPIN